MTRSFIYILLFTLLFSCKNVDLFPAADNISREAGMAYATAEIPMEEAYDNFRSSLEQNEKISIVAELDHQANAASVGMSLPPTRIIFFGNPDLGTPLMQKNQLAGLDLPQRVLFYEREGGLVVVYNSIRFLEKRYDLQGVQSLDKISTALENLSGKAAGSKIKDDASGRVKSLQGIRTIQSSRNFNDTYAALRGALETNQNVNIITELDHRANAQSAGMELRPTRVIIFGNPRMGTPLMKENPTAGLDLPQKMLVWEDETGTVNISYNAPEFLKMRHKIRGHEAELEKMATALQNLATTAAGN